MAFNEQMLQPIGGLPGSGRAARIWAYTTEDGEAAVNVEGYFAKHRFAMRVGDWIIRITLDSAGAYVGSGVHVVSTKTRTAVTCTTAALTISVASGMPLTGGVFTGLWGDLTDDAVACAGSSISDATPLTKQFNRLSSCSANQGAGLPDASTGVDIEVLNDTANDARIYPHGAGAAINSGAAGAAAILPAGLSMKFRRTGATQWRAR